MDIDNCRLVMTLLVKNEEDVLGANIKYHLEHGVDFIIATDNGSTDATPDILRKYEERGLLHLINEPSDAFDQCAWVNRMGAIAYEKYKADIIFHCDADEFWEAGSGNLKTELLSMPYIDVIRVRAQDKIMVDKNGDEKFPEDAIYAIARTSKRKSVARLSGNRYLKKSFKKVMFKTHKGLYSVTAGNHKIVDEAGGAIQKITRNIIIHHYPVRGKGHFYAKVVGGAEALSRAEHLSVEEGRHWRKWYARYQSGELESEYRTMVLTRGVADELKKKGVIRNNAFNPFSG